MESGVKSKVTVAVTVGLIAALAPSSASQAAAPQCGYYASGLSAYYNNCSDTFKEYVHVVRTLWPDDYVCLKPGIHRLGSRVHVTDAFSMYTCGVG